MQIFDVIIFFKLRTIQQKTIKPYFLLYCTQFEKEDYLENLQFFVLFCHIKKRSFNLLCVLDLFSRTLAVNSVSDYYFFCFGDCSSLISYELFTCCDVAPGVLDWTN